jgi:hypothetical protein
MSPPPLLRYAESLVRATRRTSPRIGPKISRLDTRARLQRSPTLLRSVEDGVWANSLETRVRGQPASTSNPRGQSGGIRGA